MPPLFRLVEYHVVAFHRALKCDNASPPSTECRWTPPIRRAWAPEPAEQEQAEIRLEFARLKQEHADFDAAINAMIATGCDPLQVQRMKKKKLALKDRLSALEDRIIPDIIA